MTQEKWTDNADLRADTFRHIQKRLFQMGLITGFDRDNQQPWTIETLKHVTAKLPFKMSDCDGFDDFCNRFDAWFDMEYPQPVSFKDLSVSITRHYGGVDITFGQTGIFDEFITDRQAYNTLVARVTMIHDEFARENQLQIAATSGTASQPQFIEFEPNILTHDFTDGKHSFKLKGEPYSKWGVRIWDEVLVANGINPAAVPMGDNKCSGTASVLMKGDKPQKVSKLTNFVLQLEMIPKE